MVWNVIKWSVSGTVPGKVTETGLLPITLSSIQRGPYLVMQHSKLWNREKRPVLWVRSLLLALGFEGVRLRGFFGPAFSPPQVFLLMSTP
mmetsp:Transcript_31821/g.65000  ORF Transcript_31821/g.65000 Transcript_31821/m.65000 type:complete len:90 (-) Transcript_31821:34-303(-)